MPTVYLLEAQPRTADGSGIVQVRLAGNGSRPYAGYKGFSDWRAGIINRPRFTTSTGFDQGGPNGGALPQTETMAFGSADAALLASLSGLFWKDATVTLSASATDDAGQRPTSFTTVLVGTVKDAAYAEGIVTLTLADLSVALDKPIATDTFAGTGDLEGIADAAGRIKRRTWGIVFDIEARVLDKANNIYEVGDPSRPLYSIDAVRDKGRDASSINFVAWQGSAAATLAALRAAAPPQGGATVAPSIACIKWWTQPAGPLCADLRGETAGGYTETASGVAAAIVSATSSVSTGNLGWVYSVRNYNVGIHVDTDTETAANALDRLLLPLSILWALTPAGAIVASEMKWTDPVETLESTAAARRTVYSPTRTRRVGYQKNHRLHGDGEISSVLLASVDLTYVDGTPIEVLKPAEGGANVTGNHVAYGIFGQGGLATADKADWYSQLTGKPGWVTLEVTGGQYLKSGAIYDISFGFTLSAVFPAQAGADKTSLNIAFSIQGQGALATQSSVSWNTQITLKPSWTNASMNGGTYLDSAVIFHGGENKNLASVFPGEFRANVTEVRTAAYVSGQGDFATMSSISFGDSRIRDRNAANMVYFGTSITVEQRKPEEANSNRTETRVSVSFFGQGALATLSFAGGNQLLGSSATDKWAFSNSSTYTGTGDPGSGSSGGGSGGGTSTGGTAGLGYGGYYVPRGGQQP